MQQIAQTFNPTAGGGDQEVKGTEVGVIFLGCIVTPVAADTTLLIKDGGTLIETIFVQANGDTLPVFPPPHKVKVKLVANLAGSAETATVYYRA